MEQSSRVDKIRAVPDLIARAFDGWVDGGRRMARWTADGPNELLGVVLLPEETPLPDAEMVRSFVVKRPLIFRRLRLLRVGPTPFAGYLLGGETCLAGEIRQVLGMNVLESAGALACVLPPLEELETCTEDELIDLYLALQHRMQRDHNTPIPAAYHHRDDDLLACVLRRPEGHVLHLEFDFVTWRDGHMSYRIASERVPPALRDRLTEPEAVEAETPHASAERLVAICGDLAAGRIDEFAEPAWEGYRPEGISRKLVRIATPSGVLVFGAPIDMVDGRKLRDIVAALKGRAGR